MRDDRFAESILRLVAAPERASATIGDLLEELPRHGRAWFWRTTLRTVAGYIWRDMTLSPVRMAWAAYIAWFWYMLLALAFIFVGYLLENTAWALLYVLTHRAGFELLSDIFRLRFEWRGLPQSVRVIWEATVMMAIAPFYFGQIVAVQWKERAVAFTLMLALVWSVLLGVLGIKEMFGDRVSPMMLPVISVFLILGVVKTRRTQILTT